MGGRSKKAKEHAQWKDLCNSNVVGCKKNLGLLVRDDEREAFLIIKRLASLSGIDPQQEIHCSEDTTLHPVLKDFFNTHCITCGRGYGSKNRLETHNEDCHSKNTTLCSNCLQVVKNSNFHTLWIPSSFHHVFLPSTSSSSSSSQPLDTVPPVPTAFHPSTQQLPPSPQPSILSSARHYKNLSIKSIHVPNSLVGVIIGKAGVRVNQIQNQSGARVEVAKDRDVDTTSLIRSIYIKGSPEQIAKAEELIEEILSQSKTWPLPPSQASSTNPAQSPATPSNYHIHQKNQVAQQAPAFSTDSTSASQPHAGYWKSATNTQDGSAPNYSTPGGATTYFTPQQAPAPRTPTSRAPLTQQGCLSRPSMTIPPRYPLVLPQPGQRRPQQQTSYAQAVYGQAAQSQPGFGTGYNELCSGGGGYGRVLAPAYPNDGTDSSALGAGAQAAPGGGDDT